jgi:conjugation system TraG family ATPase
MEIDRKIKELDSLFPLAGVDGGYILSKRGDVTAGWELALPEALSAGRDSYDASLRSMASAIRALPDWSIVHRQDIYLDRTYRAEGREAFLDRAYDRHFEGRRYLEGRHFLYLTLCSRAGALRDAGGCGLFGLGMPKKLPTPEELGEFAARCEEFIAVACAGGGIRARRLTDGDLAGDGACGGIIGQVFTLGGEPLSDVALTPESVRVNDEETVSYIISDSNDMPAGMDSVRRVERMSGADTEVDLGLASPVGLMLLDHPHICNTYIVKAGQQGVLSGLKTRTRRMRNFATDGANADNADGNDAFVEDYNKGSLCAVYAHSNVICWGRTEAVRLRIRSDVSAALSSMGVNAVRDIHSAPVLWYAALPGAASEIGKEHLMLTELNAALALTQFETFDRGLERGAVRLTDRLRHIPLKLDIQAEAERANLISNYNIFLDGASGTGKSFTTAGLLYGMYSYGEHVFIIDIGGSYEQVCAVVREESGGCDGVYSRWDSAHPFSFCPFRNIREWTAPDGTPRRDDPSLNFLVSLLMTLAADRDRGVVMGDFEETVILHLVMTFAGEWTKSNPDAAFPLFDEFVRWTRSYLIRSDSTDGEAGTMRPFLTRSGVRVGPESFDGGRFAESLSSYALDGQFGFLLNSREPKDLFTSRFTVFDVGELESVGNRKFYSICVLCIVNAFDLKMRSKEIPSFKVLAIDEAWKAISNETMAPYLRELWKTARKMSTSAMVITQELDDILTSDVIRETILQNSDVKILMSQESNRNSFDKVSSPLGLSKQDVNLIFSMAGKERRERDVFIKWGGSRSGVYTVEACPEQLWAFESNHQKKKPLMELAEREGSMLRAIEILSSQGRLP